MDIHRMNEAIHPSGDTGFAGRRAHRHRVPTPVYVPSDLCPLCALGGDEFSYGGRDLGHEPFGGGGVVATDEVRGDAVNESQLGELLDPLFGRAVQYAPAGR